MAVRTDGNEGQGVLIVGESSPKMSPCKAAFSEGRTAADGRTWAGRLSADRHSRGRFSEMSSALLL